MKKLVPPGAEKGDVMVNVGYRLHHKAHTASYEPFLRRPFPFTLGTCLRGETNPAESLPWISTRCWMTFWNCSGVGDG
jgi:hypothetical protein